MKKLTIIAILLVGAVSLWADLPDRTFEMGFDLGAGFANNFISVGEVFRETIEIDLTKDLKPLFFDFGADFDFFVNVNIKDKKTRKEKFGVGIFIGTDAVGQFSIPDNLFKFLQGNELDEAYEGNIGAGAAAFAEAGGQGYFFIRDFRISVRPAFFLPIAYMTPDIHYKLQANRDGSFIADFSYDASVYMPLDLDSYEFTGRGGVDLVAAVEYPLFPNMLTLGATIGHIPVFPAALRSKYEYSGHRYLEDGTDVFDEIMNGGELTLQEDPVSSADDILVFRPFKFGVNADYQPFSIKPFSFAVLPNIGFAYNAIYVAPWSFEAGLKVEAGVANAVRLGLGTGYEDKLWKHQIYLALNGRAVELDLGVALQSEDFVGSFKGSGLAVNIGMRFGW
jgi:hypothetical protein